MPKGVAVGTLAIGDPGAANAGLLAAQILGCQQPELLAKIDEFRKNQTDTILANPNPAELYERFSVRCRATSSYDELSRCAT